MTFQRWYTREDGERFPEYTPEQLKRLAEAAWGVHFLLPHPDDAPQQYAAALREFNSALTDTRPKK